MGLGPLLQHAGDLGTVEVRATITRSAGVSVRLQVVSPDVRKHGHVDRQRPKTEGDTDRALAGSAVPQVIRGEADAGARDAGFAEGFWVIVDYLLRPGKACATAAGAVHALRYRVPAVDRLCQGERQVRRRFALR